MKRSRRLIARFFRFVPVCAAVIDPVMFEEAVAEVAEVGVAIGCGKSEIIFNMN